VGGVEEKGGRGKELNLMKKFSGDQRALPNFIPRRAGGGREKKKRIWGAVSLHLPCFFIFLTISVGAKGGKG